MSVLPGCHKGQLLPRRRRVRSRELRATLMPATPSPTVSIPQALTVGEGLSTALDRASDEPGPGSSQEQKNGLESGLETASLWGSLPEKSPLPPVTRQDCGRARGQG